MCVWVCVLAVFEYFFCKDEGGGEGGEGGIG